MNKDTFTNIASSLAFETGIDIESAEKVVKWLITEGVLDMPVANETYGETENVAA